MAAKARRTSWAAPKQTLSLGPAFDKSWTETAVEYLTCSGGASAEDIRDLMKDAKTPVTLHVYAVGHAKAIQEINYVVENFLHEGGVFHGARAASRTVPSFDATRVHLAMTWVVYFFILRPFARRRDRGLRPGVFLWGLPAEQVRHLRLQAHEVPHAYLSRIYLSRRLRQRSC